MQIILSILDFLTNQESVIYLKWADVNEFANFLWSM